MAGDPDGFVRALIEANLVLAGRCAVALHPVAVGSSPKPSRRCSSVSSTAAAIPRRTFASASPRHACWVNWAIRGSSAGAGPRASSSCRRWYRSRRHLFIGSDEGLYEDEAPAHEVELAAFAIGRFPVTNAEWRCFLEAGGYEDERWWETDAAKRWQPRRRHRRRTRKKSYVSYVGGCSKIRIGSDGLFSEGRITSRQARGLAAPRQRIRRGIREWLDGSYPSGRKTEPANWTDPAFNHLAQPVVGICWHEARAYCAWLSHQTDQRLSAADRGGVGGCGART